MIRRDFNLGGYRYATRVLKYRSNQSQSNVCAPLTNVTFFHPLSFRILATFDLSPGLRFREVVARGIEVDSRRNVTLAANMVEKCNFLSQLRIFTLWLLLVDYSGGFSATVFVSTTHYADTLAKKHFLHSSETPMKGLLLLPFPLWYTMSHCGTFSF